MPFCVFDLLLFLQMCEFVFVLSRTTFNYSSRFHTFFSLSIVLFVVSCRRCRVCFAWNKNMHIYRILFYTYFHDNWCIHFIKRRCVCVCAVCITTVMCVSGHKHHDDYYYYCSILFYSRYIRQNRRKVKSKLLLSSRCNQSTLQSRRFLQIETIQSAKIKNRLKIQI